jgi:6-phosphogluconate dehydrogenase
VLERKDDEFDPQRDLLDVILDTAEQKGTGRWTAEAAFELGVPTYLISQSVFARILSGYKVYPCISELCVLRRLSCVVSCVSCRIVRVSAYDITFYLCHRICG